LPDAIVQAIAISNAKSVGEQPAILANLALANQIFATHLQQQNAIALQQALNQLSLAVVVRCAKLILTVNRDNAAEVKPVLDGLLGVLERLHQTPAPVTTPTPVKPTT